ncbi:LPP20 family lipoprotein [Marinospirillum sp.]|uniref:LPP20 family lipoprotein n=1 Tax=Marinospirillum sp. TaxID=2183934 RepID=UPI00286FDAD5|nr:LPP20 family lipoprotein [Marinospirillum sp.]MDR9466634.1 LPP20 family lipoprotein [Marinospirillum sp.]
MLKKTLFTGCLLLTLGLTAGCATTNHEHQQERETAKENNNNRVIPHSFDPVVIRVEGFGAGGTTDIQTNQQQRKLLAMRASKMDAYRAMAERVYGTRIQGNTTVQNLATRDDNIRGYVDNLVRGAKVISTSQEKDGTYKTRMELVLEPRYQHCMVKPESIVADPACSQYSVHGEHPSQRMPVTQSQPRTRYHLN